MKINFTFLLLSLGLGFMINAQTLYLPTPGSVDTFTGDVVSLEGNIAAGDFVTNTGARNIVDLVTGSQIGTNTEEFIPLTNVIRLPNGSFYTYALQVSTNNKVLIHAVSATSSWVLLPQNGFTVPTDDFFGIVNNGNTPGFWRGTQASSGNETKVFLLEGGSFVEKFDIPVSFATMTGKVKNVSNNQLFYHSIGTGYFIGDVTLDESNSVVSHNQIDTRINNNLRILGTGFIKSYSVGSNLLLVGLMIKDETTNAFHKKIYSYNTDPNLDDNLKLVELAEVGNFTGLEITPSGNGFYLLQTSSSSQWIKFPGQNQQGFESGVYFIPSAFNSLTEQEIEDLDRIVGIVNDSYFYNDKLYYACNNNQLKLVFNNQTQEFFGGMMVLNLNPPFVPTFVSEFSSSVPATVYVGDMFDPNISVASPATDSSFYIDVEEETGEVIEQDSGEFLATKAGTVTFTAYALDAGQYDQSWTVTILDTATVDTTTTAISNALPEDFNILNNGSGGNITIQTNDFGQYNIVVYNMLGQNLFARDFENEITIDLSAGYDKGIFPAVIMKGGALFRTKLHW